MSIKVIIDSREGERGFRAFKYYNDSLGYDVEQRELDSADYVFTDPETGENIGFEYKRLDDFFQSIYTQRLHNQVLDLDYTYNFVIVENDLNYENTEEVNIYYGMMASILCHTNFVSAKNEDECLYLMHKIAKRFLNKTNKIVVKRPDSKQAPAPVLYLSLIRGVGLDTAISITETYNIRDLTDLLGLNYEKLLEIPKIGKKTAENILSAIKK